MPDATIERFLDAPRDDLVVEREQELVIEPSDGKYGRYAHSLEVRSFEDLQVLRLIPARLDEGKVREAIHEDDAQAQSQARQRLSSRSDPCGCEERPEGSSAPPLKFSYRNDLRATYNAIRKTQHASLAGVISEATNAGLTADSLKPKHVWGWISAIDARVVLEWIALLFKDISIMHNATLNLSSSLDSLWAGDIRIHSGGKLVINSSYMQIRCFSVQGDIP